MLDILRDIKSGALPVEEIPGFLWWLVGKSFWFWFGVIIVGLLFVVR